MSDFREFLDGVPNIPQGTRYEPKCQVCRDPVLAKEVAEYATGRQEGTIAFSIHAIWMRYFGPVRGVGSANSLRTHIRMHLGIHDL